MSTVPDVVIKLYLVPYGYQISVDVDGVRVKGSRRDYAGETESKAAHINTILEELDEMLRRLRDRF